MAIARNAAHGLQLSTKDKQKNAKRIYEACLFTNQREREAKKKHLASILSVSERTISKWLSRMDKDAKAELRERAFALWLACHTQEEIAEAIGYSRPAVSAFCESFVRNGESAVSDKTDKTEADEENNNLGSYKLSKSQLADADHATEFTTPIYNIWKQQEKSKGRDRRKPVVASDWFYSPWLTITTNSTGPPSLDERAVFVGVGCQQPGVIDTRPDVLWVFLAMFDTQAESQKTLQNM